MTSSDVDASVTLHKDAIALLTPTCKGATLQSEVLKIRGINDLFNSAIATKYLFLLRI
ncbi:hypothetical protein [uncultured Nostoc sp.]|uniref:hypothetical protein n=1 Tax=uncultured Nostoc sp. TaxID=340711 RepID=UPI0035C98DF3